MKKIESLESRIPEHAETLRKETAADLGCDVDELPAYDELTEVIG